MSFRTMSRNLLSLAIAASIASFAVAQTPAPAAPAPAAVMPATIPTQTPPFNGIAHIAIRVKDIATSVAFYNKLGFQQAFANTAADGTVTQAFIKINDKQFIELYPVTAHDPDAGFLHLCFEGADLNALHDFYVAEGLAPIAVRKAGAGNLLFTLKGPEQPAFPQNIEYTQYMPDSRHSKDAGLHLGPDRVADKMVRVDLAMQDFSDALNFYITKLRFPASKYNAMPDPMLLNLPGGSGQQIRIDRADQLGTKSSIVLTTPSPDRSAALLTQQKVDFKRIPIKFVNKPSIDGPISIIDPDGNIILVTAAPTQN